ncbi:hypothetical protein DYH09_28985 [bacterium CPR1]|nr:hypothetical protein [bacterium CPR1]
MRRRGASLAEAILCFAILTLVVLLIFNLYPTSVAAVRVSGQRLQANALADSILEEQLTRPFSQLVPGPTQALPAVPGRGATFQPSVQFFAVNRAGIDPGLLVGVRVRVVWTDHQVQREILREAVRCDVRI